MYAIVLCLSMFSYHKSLFWRNGRTNRAVSWHEKLCLALYYKDIRVPPKIRILFSGTLPRTLDSQNFATAGGSCSQQNSSTVELVDHTDDDRRVAVGRIQFIGRTCWSTVTLCLNYFDLLYNLLLDYSAAVDQISTDTAR